MSTGWIGVDFDGTLAKYDEWRGSGHTGEPIPKMVERVKKWLEDGKSVRIFSARVFPGTTPEQNRQVEIARGAIRRWCTQHLGRALTVTYAKDRQMVEMWDDRCVQVIPNTGERVDGKS